MELIHLLLCFLASDDQLMYYKKADAVIHQSVVWYTDETYSVAAKPRNDEHNVIELDEHRTN